VHCVNACVNFEANRIYNSPHLAGGGAQAPPNRGEAPKFSRTLDTLG